jgi:hypothetical protein
MADGGKMPAGVAAGEEGFDRAEAVVPKAET